MFQLLLRLIWQIFQKLWNILKEQIHDRDPLQPSQPTTVETLSQSDDIKHDPVEQQPTSLTVKQKLRVLHLTTEFPPVIYGGLGTAVGGLVNASTQAGMAVGVLLVGETDYRGYGHLVTAEPTNNSDLQTIATSTRATLFQVGWFETLEAVIRLVQQWQPDVIHLHSFWLWSLAQALQERLGIPLVYTVHSLDRAEYEIGQGPSQCLWQWQTQEDVIAHADRIIALTESERELLADYCPVAKHRVRVVGNGIDDCAEARQAVQRNWSHDAPIVLYTGRFVERKGVRELIAAIPEVLNHAPRTRFVLAGGHRNCSGAEMEHWWLPAELQPYRQQIHFTGWLTPQAIAEWYRAADILVVPSWYEPFGMVILEGMLYGLPIAAAAVGGPAEILEHGRTGLLFPPKDVEAIAEAILQLVENPQLRQQLGTRAAKDVRQKWLWSRIVEKMHGVYTEATNTALCSKAA